MLIAFTGKAGAGKSTAAGVLIDIAISGLLYEKVVPVSFAEPIKRIARNHFGWDGRKDERGRRLLQILGTEAGRAYDPDLWVKTLMRRIDVDEDDALWVCDDLRFPNEAAAVRNRGGHIFRVIGRGSDLAANAEHASESGLPDAFVTGTLANDGDRQALRLRVRELADRYLAPQGVTA
jgi:hypothetical protein